MRVRVRMNGGRCFATSEHEAARIVDSGWGMYVGKEIIDRTAKRRPPDSGDDLSRSKKRKEKSNAN